MAYDEDSFTPEEQAQAARLDQQIDEHLRALPFLPPDQRPASDPLLIHELTRFYQPEAEEIQSRLQRARARVEQQRAQSPAQQRRKRLPLIRPRPLRERQDQMHPFFSRLRPSQRSSRLAALAAALLLIVLVGGLATGLILVRSRGSATAQPTQPTGTLAPGPKKTATPGPTPTPGSTPGIQGLVSIKMLDANNGWAVTAENHILHTSDGANHWQDVTPPSIDPPQAADSSNLTSDFLSPTVAWVYSFVRDANDTGGTTKYYRTTNGGQTWLRAIHQGDVPNQIIFTDSEHGWMFSSLGVASGSEGVDIFRTANGGATWTNVASAGPSTAGQPGALPFDGGKTGIGARDAVTAWVAGEDANFSFVWLYVTHDGGQTWQHQTLPVPANVGGQVVTYPPTFFNAQDGILPVTLYAGGVAPFVIFVTHDGGATWQRIALPIAPDDVDFINVNQGWVADGSPYAPLYVTSDGGQHWTKLPTDPNFNNISVLNFVSSKIGWAIANPEGISGPTTLLKTTDGGKTWQIQAAV